MDIKILNADKLIVEFAKLQNINLMPVITDSTRRVQKMAKTLVAKDTGDLMRSIFALNYPNLLTGVVGTNLEYAVHQEFGTRFQRGTPYLRPALALEEKNFHRRMKEYIAIKLLHLKK